MYEPEGNDMFTKARAALDSIARDLGLDIGKPILALESCIRAKIDELHYDLDRAYVAKEEEIEHYQIVRNALDSIAHDCGISTDDSATAIAANIRDRIARLARGAVSADARIIRVVGALQLAIEALRSPD